MEMPRDKKAWLDAYRARCEAVERVRTQELVHMPDAEALRRLGMLRVAGKPYRAHDDWSGLVEQQALFSRMRQR